MTLPEKVSPGDGLRYPADFFNLQIDMAEAFQRRQRSADADGPQFRAARGQVVYVKNSTAYDLNQFAALRITGILFSPSDRLIEFKTNWAFTANSTGNDRDPLCVFQEPVKAGKIARAVVDGMTPAKVQVNTNGHNCAILDTGVTTGRLKTDVNRGAEIVYKAGTSGEQWAIVRLMLPSKRTTRYKGQLQGAMASGDSTKTVDNLEPIDGSGGDTSLTAYNVHGWAGDDNAICRIEWVEDDSRWEFYQVTCPA